MSACLTKACSQCGFWSCCTRLEAATFSTVRAFLLSTQFNKGKMVAVVSMGMVALEEQRVAEMASLKVLTRMMSSTSSALSSVSDITCELHLMEVIFLLRVSTHKCKSACSDWKARTIKMAEGLIRKLGRTVIAFAETKWVISLPCSEQATPNTWQRSSPKSTMNPVRFLQELT